MVTIVVISSYKGRSNMYKTFKNVFKHNIEKWKKLNPEKIMHSTEDY